MTIKVSRQQGAFEIGDRVSYSKLGRARCRSDPQRLGTVTGYSRMASAVQVRFDGRKTSTIVHVTYLQSIEVSRAVAVARSS